MSSTDELHLRYHLEPNFVKLKPDQEIGEVIKLFNRNRIFGAPVVDDLGNLVGMLSGTDCIAAALKANFDSSFRGLVEDFMTKDVQSVDADYSVVYVAEKFLKENFRRYPVVENAKVIGMIGRVDVLKALEKYLC